MRLANRDYKIPNTNHIIKKNTHVWIPNIGFHRDEKYWKNAHKFDPENFSHEENVKRKSFVFMPFGEGPRNCFGMR
jgi:cytochrome P450 family 6